MNTNNKKDPDYGEPWAIDRIDGFLNKVVDAKGSTVAGVRPTRRAVQCVNACAGMADPAAELAAMREAMREAEASLAGMVQWFANMHRPGLTKELLRRIDACDAAFVKLQPFIK